MPLLSPKGSPRHQEQNSQLHTPHSWERSQEVPSVHLQRVLPRTKAGNCKGKSDNKKGNRTFQKGSHIPSHSNCGGVGWEREGGKHAEKPPGWSGGCGGGGGVQTGCLLWATPEGMWPSCRMPRCREGDPDPISPQSMWGSERFSTGKEKHVEQTGLSSSPVPSFTTTNCSHSSQWVP